MILENNFCLFSSHSRILSFSPVFYRFLISYFRFQKETRRTGQTMLRGAPGAGC